MKFFEAPFHGERIQCFDQLMEEYDQLTKLLKLLQAMPESHNQFQVTLARFLRSQKRIFDYKSTLEAQMEGK